MAKGINRKNTTEFPFGVVISDCETNSGIFTQNGIGKSKYQFIPAGWVLNPVNGNYDLDQPNIISYQIITQSQICNFTSPLFADSNDVFGGYPLQIIVGGSVSTGSVTITLTGMNEDNIVSESILISSVESDYYTSVNRYTSLLSVYITNTNNLTLNNFYATTIPIIFAKKDFQPEVSASVDVNSKTGSVLFPRMSQQEIEMMTTGSLFFFISNLF